MGPRFGYRLRMKTQAAPASFDATESALLARIEHLSHNASATDLESIASAHRSVAEARAAIVSAEALARHRSAPGESFIPFGPPQSPGGPTDPPDVGGPGEPQAVKATS